MARLRAQLTTLVVLSAYLAAHTLGALVHESLHTHAHVHAGDCQHVHAHVHQPADACSTAGSSGESQPVKHGWSGLADAHDHDCVVCRVTGQPVVAAAAASISLVAELCQEAADHAATQLPAPRALASQARAPPLPV